MRRIASRGWLTLVLLLLAPGRGFSQGEQQSGALIVSGHPGHVPVTQINGRPYMAVDALARLMNVPSGIRGARSQ